MPIWLRRLTYNHLVSFTTKESEQKNANSATEGVTKIDFNKLDEAKRLMGENAGYTVKASKK